LNANWVSLSSTSGFLILMDVLNSTYDDLFDERWVFMGITQCLKMQWIEFLF